MNNLDPDLSPLPPLPSLDDPKGWFEAALATTLHATGATAGSISAGPPGGLPVWRVSSGVAPNSAALIRRAFEAGEPQSADAAHGRRLHCIPIGRTPPLGIIYLEAPQERSEVVLEVAVKIAARLAPLVSRLLIRCPNPWDPVGPYRATLDLGELAGQSQALAHVLGDIAMVRELDVPVLFGGPTGTGKTTLARILHANGPRRSRPFVEVNVSSIPPTLFEAELFGTRPGAFTNATSRPGLVRSARGGTLFLDEIGDLPLELQPKLLQLLESGVYFPVGQDTPQRADVRIIAATHVDLHDAMAEGRFRADLYYRLAVVPIHVPGLEERQEDIPVLAASLLARAADRHRRPAVTLSSAAAGWLCTHPWPGHVRQLANAVERAAIRAWAEGVQEVTPEHLGLGAAPIPSRLRTLAAAMDAAEREAVRQALARNPGNRAAAARELGIARSYLYTLVAKHGLQPQNQLIVA